MKKDIFDYSVDEIHEYMLNLCEHNGAAGDAFNIVLSSFALLFFACPNVIIKENTKELPSIIDYVTKENIEKVLAKLLEIKKAFNL